MKKDYFTSRDIANIVGVPLSVVRSRITYKGYLRIVSVKNRYFYSKETLNELNEFYKNKVLTEMEIKATIEKNIKYEVEGKVCTIIIGSKINL